MKERFQKVAGFSKLKYINFREMLKKQSVPGELAQRDVIPEYPLILLHGYWNTPNVWEKFVTFFESNGYSQEKNLFLFDGRVDNESPAIIDIQINATKLQHLVQHVLTSTGSSKVDLVAHSMGGLISRVYIEQFGGDDKVHKLIMLGTPNHGSKYLPLFTRIVEFIDSKLEMVEASKEKFDQMKEQNVLYRAIQKVKHKDKKSLEVSDKIDQTMDQKTDQLPENEEPIKMTWSSFEKKTEEAIEEHIQQVAAENDIDHLGMAAIQMDPGSEFLTTLGYKGRANYYLITGIKGLPAGIDSLLPEGRNDGVVHADSVDLTDVPVSHKVTFKVNHTQLRSKIVVFNQIMNFLVL